MSRLPHILIGALLLFGMSGCRTYEKGAIVYELSRCNVVVEGAATNIYMTTHGGVSDSGLTVPIGGAGK